VCITIIVPSLISWIVCVILITYSNSLWSRAVSFLLRLFSRQLGLLICVFCVFCDWCDWCDANIPVPRLRSHKDRQCKNCALFKMNCEYTDIQRNNNTDMPGRLFT